MCIKATVAACMQYTCMFFQCTLDVCSFCLFASVRFSIIVNIYMCIHLPQYHCILQSVGYHVAAAACGGYALDKEERGQTVGMQHMHLHSFHCQQDHPTVGSSCAASVTDGSTVHISAQWDQESSRDVE